MIITKQKNIIHQIKIKGNVLPHFINLIVFINLHLLLLYLLFHHLKAFNLHSLYHLMTLTKIV